MNNSLALNRFVSDNVASAYFIDVTIYYKHLLVINRSNFATVYVYNGTKKIIELLPNEQILLKDIFLSYTETKPAGAVIRLTSDNVLTSKVEVYNYGV